MKLPKSLRDKDPLLGDLPQMDSEMEFSDHEWTVEELDDVDRQVQQELWEEAFIEACFEEMLAEEEAQWQHYSTLQHYNQPWESHSWEIYAPPTYYQTNTDYQRQLLVSCSKLNPEAPEFIPRGLAS